MKKIYIYFVLLLAVASCLEKNEPDTVPGQRDKPVLKGARKISFVVDAAYDLSKTEAHSVLDSTSMGDADQGLYVPKGHSSSAFFLDNTSGEILAVVQTDTLSDKVLVNAESVAKALLVLVPSYNSLSLQQQMVFEREAMQVKLFQDFVSQVDALLKAKRPIYSTDPAFLNKLTELNTYIIKNQLKGPDLTHGKKDPRRIVRSFKEWLPVKDNAIVNQVHSYVYAEFVPSGGGAGIPTVLDPNPLNLTEWSKTPLAGLGLKDDYYTVNINQTHEKATSKNLYELSVRFVKALLSAVLGRMGSETRNDCIAAIAGSIQVDVTAAVMEIGGGAELSASGMFKKVAQTVENGVLAGMGNNGCRNTLLNQAVVAKAVVSQTNVLLKMFEVTAFAKDVVEFYPFVKAQIDPVIMSNKMQVYKGKLVPGWVKFQEIQGSTLKEYSPGATVRPAVEAKIISSYDQIDLGQFEATWIVTNGNGQINPVKTPFNSEGKTVTSWYLPTHGGEYTVRADVLDKEREDLQGAPVKFEVKVVQCDPKSILGTWTVEMYNTCYPNPDGTPAYYTTNTLTLYEGGKSVFRYYDGSEKHGTYTYNPNDCSFTYNNLSWCGGARAYPPSSPSYKGLYSCGCLSLKHIKQ